PAQSCPPGAAVHERAQHGGRGGLAGAVGAEEPEQLARLDRERDAVDGGEVAEPLDQAVDLDGFRPVRHDHDDSGYRPPDRARSSTPVIEHAPGRRAPPERAPGRLRLWEPWEIPGRRTHPATLAGSACTTG